MGVGIDFQAAKQLLVTAILLAAVDCAPAPGLETRDQPNVKPGDNAYAKAVWLEWNGFLDRPSLRYVEGDALNCDTRLGPGFLDGNGQCILGRSLPDEYAVEVVWHGGLHQGVTDQAIVHEFCHYANDWDINHQGPCSQAEDGRIVQITQALRARFAR